MAAAGLGERAPDAAALDALARGAPLLAVDDLVAGYGRMEILHGITLRVAAGQSLCLIGPNGAGKSTVLHSIYGFTRIAAGRVTVGGGDVTRLPPNEKLARARIATSSRTTPCFPT